MTTISRPTTGSPTSPPTPSPSSSPGSHGCAGRSSSTTSSSKANSASITRKVAPGLGGTTTPPWSPPPTASSRSSDSNLFTRGQADTPEGRPADTADLQVLDRPLRNLPTTDRPHRPRTAALTTRRMNLTKHYYDA